MYVHPTGGWGAVRKMGQMLLSGGAQLPGDATREAMGTDKDTGNSA